MVEALIFLAAAVICVPLAKRLGLGSVMGYLIAGAVIGPWGLRLVDDTDATHNLAELGVVLMLFVIGLELDPRRFLAMRGVVFRGGVIQLAASCSVPPPNTVRFISESLRGSSSRPITKSMSTTPSSARFCADSMCEMRRRPHGPMSAPAMR